MNIKEKLDALIVGMIFGSIIGGLIVLVVIASYRLGAYLSTII